MSTNVVLSPAPASRLLAFLTRHVTWLVVVFAMALAGHSLRHVTESNIKADARQNLTIAYNLAKRGEFSESKLTKAAEPSNLREPFPIWVVAAYLKTVVLPGQPSVAVDLLASGPNAALIKRHNAIWVFLGVLGCWYLFHALTGSHAGALVASVFIFALFLDSPHLVNTLYTELPATVLLVWSSWALVRASTQPCWRNWLIAGCVLGLLALTKAIFLYAAAGCVLMLTLAQWIWPTRNHHGNKLQSLRLALAVCLGLAVVTGPWMLRNWAQFGSLEITEGRGGWVLYKRHLLNQMTAEEYRGAFALYGPTFFRDLVAGTRWAVKRDDLTRSDGRLSRLHIGASEFQRSDLQAQRKGRPDLAVTYYRQTSATAVMLRNRHAELGDPFPRVQADHDMRDMAIAGMKLNPGRHLKVTLLMAWRGFWSFPAQLPWLIRTDPMSTARAIEGLNLLGGLSMYALFLLGWRQRRMAWLAFSIAPLSLVALYALLSQGLPRFTAPANPLILMALFVLIHAAWQRWGARRDGTSVPADTLEAKPA